MANANLTQKGELQTSFWAGQVKERGRIKRPADVEYLKDNASA